MDIYNLRKRAFSEIWHLYETGILSAEKAADIFVGLGCIINGMQKDPPSIKVVFDPVSQHKWSAKGMEEVNIQLDEPEWYDEDPGTCIHCGTKWEWVRPGKSQPTCECDDYCYAHTPPVKMEHRAFNHPSRMTGIVCPACFPEEKQSS